MGYVEQHYAGVSSSMAHPKLKPINRNRQLSYSYSVLTDRFIYRLHPVPMIGSYRHLINYVMVLIG